MTDHLTTGEQKPNVPPKSINLRRTIILLFNPDVMPRQTRHLVTTVQSIVMTLHYSLHYSTQCYQQFLTLPSCIEYTSWTNILFVSFYIHILFITWFAFTSFLPFRYFVPLTITALFCVLFLSEYVAQQVSKEAMDNILKQDSMLVWG